ncbi:probable L-type lectin-domain containing receptor kinase S.7 [Vicia villosa]|uniref:probable L-type lectin-domain containing receptor kinase S.7 n=1 Tax=Vicia villosa TaxID=3911 RepID=UPI00273A8781|nr:probable L-type lectin-domain containing receptor kinase S.7 [Vicia villosa]
MHPFKPTLFTLFSTFILAAAGNIQLNFPYFTTTNITFTGDSSLTNRLISLTKPTPLSTGSILYNNPIPLFDKQTNTTSSFSTTFSFSITNPNNPTSFGDGFCFFLSPNNLSSTSSFSSSFSPFGLPTNFVAVEFDTRFDPRFNDPNENHIGFNIDSLNSLRTVDPIFNGIDLKSGNTITSWIDYKTDQNSLSVFLSYSGIKPLEPILFVNVDLSEYFRDNQDVYVGFSASAEKSTELHQIESWRFYTIGFEPVRPRLRSYNVSDNSVIGNAIKGNVHRSRSSNSKKRLGFGFAVAGPVFFCAVFSLLGYYSFVKWKKVKKESSKDFDPGFVACPREFDYKELKSATREFHPSRIVGHGSFGTVYKAFFISSGTIAAVKRSRHSHEGKTEFLSELSIIAGLRHKNLVQLLGWCVEKGELLLVYDFMPNGSLDKMLYKEPERGKLLTWSNRFNIVVGLASVLVYLHQECEQRVIHRDIKTGNVLLDGNFNARLGDFGLAKLMDHDKSPVSTLTAGTMGYLAPEYLQYGKATDKTDVFSYGIVVLEVACGKRPIEREGQKMVNLVDWVWGLYSEGKITEAVDKRLNGEFEVEEMKKLLMLGLSCANPDSAERPTMRRVLQILNNEVVPFALPKVKPTLTFSSDLPLSIDEIVCDEGGEDCQEFNTNQSMCEIKID